MTAARTLTALTALVVPAASAHAAYPVAPAFAPAFAFASLDPAAVPPGANRPGCRSAVDPHPVILVNGTGAVMESDFGSLAPRLANDGYCVYTFDFGALFPNSPLQALGPVPASARALAGFVQQVKAATGADTVDLVGHSQGGMLSEYYAKLLHGAPNIHDIVALSPTTHGTSLLGLFTLAASTPGLNPFVFLLLPAAHDQEQHSAVITALDAGPIAQPGVAYTVIETRNETVVTPVGSSFIAEPGVTNEFVQSFCPLDTVDHLDLPYDNVVVQLIENALVPATAHAPDCTLAYPVPAF